MSKKKSRPDWTRAGLRRLAASGIEAVRIEPLAKELGVTKGSFYWHFRDRGELLTAMLEEFAAVATEGVIDQAEQAGFDAAARLERLTKVATRGFDAKLELALREWSRNDPAAGKVLDKIDRRRLGYLRELLQAVGFEALEAETRAFLFYSSLLGNDLLPAAHGRYSRKRVLQKSFEILSSSGIEDR